MTNFLAVAIAVFLDRLFGELPIYHPLRGFTHLATYLEDSWHLHEELNKHAPTPAVIKSEEAEETNAIDEQKQNKAATKSNEQALIIKGSLATLFLILPFVSLAAIISQSLAVPLNFVFDVFVLYLALGAHNLKQHSLDVQNALIAENLEVARKNLSTIVNRDTNQMDRQDIMSTCVESILENGSEMILAPIFWYLIFGAPGAVLYSLIHSLHNMWGYQSTHYKDFGWAVVKVNDILNWIPSRLTAFSYMLLGDMKNAWSCFNSQVKKWNSPNAQVAIATGAGALNLELGGSLYYQGQLKTRAILGQGRLPDLSDIARANDLVERSMVLWLAFTLVISIGH